MLVGITIQIEKHNAVQFVLNNVYFNWPNIYIPFKQYEMFTDALYTLNMACATSGKTH